MNDAMIKLGSVNKIFSVPHERRNTLKESLINFHRRLKYEDFYALKNIDLEVKQGEFVGIIGKNGSGKSTLLKVMANIYKPTSGNVYVNGSLSPFLELGVGFNGDLTARENVYLNGVILGLSYEEINEKYKAIVDFAELEDFMEMKLKNFSSGMQVRLAFSVAIQVDVDIYLCDEVLAVGDLSFQKKCLNVFGNLKKSGKTIVYVSHDMDSIKEFCDKTAFVENGEIKMFGETDESIQKYLQTI